MKIGGIDPSTLPNEEVLVLPRGDKQIVFRAQGLPDMDAFNAQVPEPKVPMAMGKNGLEPMVQDTNYQNDLTEYNKRRLGYIMVNTLKPSDIEWDTVKADVPGTWGNWEPDLKAAGLNQRECNLVLTLVMQANSLDDAKLEKARLDFLRGPTQATTAAK